MDEPTKPTELSDSDYRWAMRMSRQNGPDSEDEKMRYESIVRTWFKLNPPDQEFERTAFHESGHAVAAHSFGFPVPYVLLRDDGSGEVPFHPPAIQFMNDPAEMILTVRQTLIVKVAGSVAEEIRWRIARLPEKNVLTSTLSLFGDLLELTAKMDPEARRRLFAFASAGNSTDPYAVPHYLIDQAELSARVILEENWTVLEQLAARVLSSRHVPGPEMRVLLSEVKPTTLSTQQLPVDG